MGFAVPVQKQKIISFPEKLKLTPKLCLYLFDSGYALLLFGVWIKFGFKARKPEDMSEAWGLSYVHAENCLIANWGPKNKVLYMPWDKMRVKCDVLNRDAQFVKFIPQGHPHFKKMLDANHYKDDRAMQEAPFTYITKKGVIQKTTAVFYVTRSTFKWRLLARLGIGPTKISHEINVTFKNEIGEGVGTWRGGRTGGTFEITAEDKSPFHTLHRINMTKRF